MAHIQSILVGTVVVTPVAENLARDIVMPDLSVDATVNEVEAEAALPVSVEASAAVSSVSAEANPVISAEVEICL